MVDDFRPWRNFVCLMFAKVPELEVVAQAADGLEAVRKAGEVQPDLILLDIGLPNLNGIAAARLIRQCAPQSRILFASQDRSGEYVETCLDVGALGYIVKSDAAGELLPAVDAVLRGKQHVSACLARPFLVDGECSKPAPRIKLRL